MHTYHHRNLNHEYASLDYCERLIPQAFALPPLSPSSAVRYPTKLGPAQRCVRGKIFAPRPAPPRTTLPRAPPRPAENSLIFPRLFPAKVGQRKKLPKNFFFFIFCFRGKGSAFLPKNRKKKTQTDIFIICGMLFTCGCSNHQNNIYLSVAPIYHI